MVIHDYMSGNIYNMDNEHYHQRPLVRWRCAMKMQEKKKKTTIKADNKASKLMLVNKYVGIKKRQAC